jgi:hypothetical protein
MNEFRSIDDIKRKRWKNTHRFRLTIIAFNIVANVVAGAVWLAVVAVGVGVDVAAIPAC